MAAARSLDRLRAAVAEERDAREQVRTGSEALRAAREARIAALVALRALGASWDALARAVAQHRLGALHDRHGLTELEEGWLVRALYREDKLAQPAIGRLLGRHKSWVCRRLMLVESLDDAVQADVRLGLIAPSAAAFLAQLQRCNQRPVWANRNDRGPADSVK